MKKKRDSIKLERPGSLEIQIRGGSADPTSEPVKNQAKAPVSGFDEEIPRDVLRWEDEGGHVNLETED